MRKLIVILFALISISKIAICQSFIEEINSFINKKEEGSEFLDYSALVYSLKNDTIKQLSAITHINKQYGTFSPAADGLLLELIYQITKKSTSLAVRKEGVEILVEEFYNPVSNKRDIIAFNKEDFSEKSQHLLLKYIQREFDSTKILRDWCKYDLYSKASRNKNYKWDSSQLDSLCESYKRKDIDDIFNAINNSPEIVLLLGWLDINEAIPYLEDLINSDESQELKIVSKLALSRLGEDKYKKELLSQLHETPWNANNKGEFKKKLTWLHYINSREIIAEYLIGLESIEPSYCMDYDPPVPTNYKVLAYLPTVFSNFIFSSDYLGIMICDPSLIDKKDIKRAKNWIIENKENIVIDDKSFIYPYLGD